MVHPWYKGLQFPVLYTMVSYADNLDELASLNQRSIWEFDHQRFWMMENSGNHPSPWIQRHTVYKICHRNARHAYDHIMGQKLSKVGIKGRHVLPRSFQIVEDIQTDEARTGQFLTSRTDSNIRDTWIATLASKGRWKKCWKAIYHLHSSRPAVGDKLSSLYHGSTRRNCCSDRSYFGTWCYI